MEVQPLKHPNYRKLGQMQPGMLVEVFDEHLVSEGFYITMDTSGDAEKYKVFDPRSGKIKYVNQYTRIVAYPGASIVKDYIEGATLPSRGREHG